MLCFSINNVKAQSVGDEFTIEYDDYTLLYKITKLNPNTVSVKCDNDWYSWYEEEVDEDINGLTIHDTITDNNGNVYTVTSIALNAFAGKELFTGQLNLPSTITTISGHAFEDTQFKGSLIIPENVKSIGSSAFEGCKKITNIALPNNIKKIASSCFKKCNKVTSVEFGNNITEIDDAAFSGCTSLKEIKLPQKIKIIGEEAFYNTKLTEVVLYNSVEEIGDNAFYTNNKNLTKVMCNLTSVPEMVSYGFGEEFNKNLKIYVPACSYDEYITTENWSYYKDHIVALPTFVRDGSLNDGNNWYPIGVPSGDDVVVFINANGTIAGGEDPFHVNSFYMGDNGSITIRETPAGIGQIIHHADSDEVSIIKHIEPYIIKEDGYLESGWYTISTPINDLVLSDNNFLKDGYELFRYNESNYEWENHKNPNNDFTTLDAGRGYIYANRDQQIITITGKLNVDKETKCYITAFGEYLRGFNLIGNPYMHDIHKGEGCAIFHKYLSTGFYTLSNDGWWAPCPDGTAAIAPLQSILIQTDFDVDLTIEKNTNKPYKPRSLNNGLVTINVSNEKYKDAAYVTFNEGLGLQKISHRNNAIPMVYIPIDNIDYAIAIMDDKAEEIPINFEAMTMGEYTISVSSTECNYNGITLIDRLTGTETNMLVEDYKFLATTNDNPERFIIKVSINESTEADIFTQDDNIIINNIKGNGTIQIYDVTGRAMIKQNTSGSNCQISSYAMANGIYIVNVADDNGITTKKIMINNK